MIDYIILALLFLLTLCVLLGKTIKVELHHTHSTDTTTTTNTTFKDTTEKAPVSNYVDIEEDPDFKKLQENRVDPMQAIWETVHNIMEGSEVNAGNK